LQVVYNRLDRRPEEMYFAHAQQDNLGILGRVPLASGLLAGKSWCLRNPLVSAVIPGCKTPAQVEANAAAAGLPDL